MSGIPSIPFVPGTYDYRPGERIADLIMRGGEQQANRQARSGEIWGGAINQLGQIGQQAYDKHKQDEEQAQVGGAVSAAMSPQYPSATKPVPGSASDVPDPGANHIQAILDNVDPKLRPSVMKGIQDFNAAQDVADERRSRIAQAQRASQQADADAAATLAHGVISHKFLDGPDGGLGALTSAATIAKAKGAPWASAWDTELQQATQAMQQAGGDPGAMKAVADTVRSHFGPRLAQLEMAASQGLQETWRKDATPIKLGEGDTLVSPTDFSTVAKGAEKPVNLQHVETDKGIQSFDPRAGTLGPVIGKGKPPASTIINTGQANDVKEAVTAMKEGTAPPLLPGRASKEYLATMAEAHRQGFDLATAATDWVATQKHIASMNSNSQLKLNQAINQLPELLDSVDSLASQWKGGRFPILNKANLAAAKAGAYGSDVAAVAKQLEAQIADVTADLGNVYMGGNSPTDHALDLAAKSLGADWDEKVLHKMVDLARKNVTIRQNSIKHTGVAGASEGNPYGNQRPAPPVQASAEVTATGPNGQKLVLRNGKWVPQ